MKGLPRKATTYSPTFAVPSALTGLTTLFGMVRGEPRRYNHLKFWVDIGYALNAYPLLTGSVDCQIS